MQDIYATLNQAEPNVARQIADRLELRAADSKQRAMLHAYLAEVNFPDAASVLEVGCGSGAVTRVLARWPCVGQVVGLDPSEVLLQRARELAVGIDNVSFDQGDARELPYSAALFDVVVFHTTLCHVPGPEVALAEARRVLRPGGRLVIFDGDYATASIAIGAHDPLQACVDAAFDTLVHDRWLVRRLPTLVRSAGFDVWDLRGHSYVQTAEVDYLLSLISLGVDLLVESGRITPAFGAALCDEARRRHESGAFFGHIAYASLLAVRSAPARPEPVEG